MRAPAAIVVLLAGLTACRSESRGPAPSTPAPSPPTALQPPAAAVSTPAAASGAPSGPSTGDGGATTSSIAPRGPAHLTTRRLALPDTHGHATLDYLVFEPTHGRLWVPVGETGSVDVLDPASGQFTRVDGFAKAEREAHGQKRMMGPSSGAAGEGFVYVGDRASSEVCAVDAGTLERGACLQLSSPPDGMAYVTSARELWVTTPRDSSVTVLDASKPGVLARKAVIKTPGSPEGYAVDEAHGAFHTNLEDKDQTLAIDLKTRTVRSTWPSGCGAAGPRGIAVDSPTRIVMVACTDHVQILDGARDGAPVAKVAAGDGVDNVDWLASRRLIYVSAAKAAELTVIRVDDRGQPTVVATASTAEGARNGVVDASGNAYVADPMHGGIVIAAFGP